MVGCDVEGPLWAVLGADMGLCRRSWEWIRASVGCLGSGSGPTWAVLGVDQGLCGRSWERIGAKSGPGSSGKAIWAGIWVEKWPWLEREGDQVRDQGPLASSIRRGLLRIFSIDYSYIIHIYIYIYSYIIAIL